MYALVSPFSKTFDDLGLIYFVPENFEDKLQLGQVINIPIKNNIETGLVLKIVKNLDNLDIKYDISKIKSIISIKNKNIFLNDYQIKIIYFISEFYFSLIHNSLNLFFPRNLKSKIMNGKIDLSVNKKHIYSFLNNNKLSNKQNEVLEKINNSKNNKILFYGLTGSGKTEIYISLIKKNLDLGKQSLLLIPEIILTKQIHSRIKKVFGDEVLVINSTVSEANKTKNWTSIYNTNAKIIIGTRSALFYPYNNLGLIIIDEEHDNSYISDSTPRYNTIEVAEQITEINGNKLILASGTPSFKSMYKSIKKAYSIVSLLEKYIP